MPHTLRWLLGFATSLTGNHVYQVVLAWVAVKNASPAEVGWILVAGATPQVILLLVGGVLVDRFGPKPTIIVSDLLRVLLMVGLALVVTPDRVNPVVLAVLAAAVGTVEGLFQPAISSAPRYLARPEDLTRIVAAATMVRRGAEFAGAPLGSYLILAIGAASALWTNTILFVISVILLCLTRMTLPIDPDTGVPAVSERRPMATELRAGFAIIRSHAGLATVLAVVFVAEIGFAGPMMAGVPLLAGATNWGPQLLGWVLGAFGLGSAAMAGLLAWRRWARPAWTAAGGLVAMGGGVLGLGLLAHSGLRVDQALVVAGALGLAAGIGASLYGTLITTAVLKLAPSGQIGLVMSSLTLASLSAVPITFALTGALTGWTSAAVPFLVGGPIVLAAAAAYLIDPRVRRIVAGTTSDTSVSGGTAR